jgi:hypothetical protein
MANTFPEYLPVHSLSTESSPSVTDSVVMQKTSDATNGDVELLTIASLFNLLIDRSTLDLYTAMGWES